MAAEISRFVAEAGFGISEAGEASIVVVGPSVSASELAGKVDELGGREVVFVVPDGEVCAKLAALDLVVPQSRLPQIKSALAVAAERLLQRGRVAVARNLVRVRRALGIPEASSLALARILRALTESLPLGVVVLSRSRGVVGANRLARDILRAQDIVGIDCETFQERFGLCPGGVGLLNTIDSSHPIIFTHRFPDGRVVEVYIAAVPGSDEFVFTISDITEHSWEREWLEGLLGAIADGVVVIDRERRILWMNDVVRRWFGSEAVQVPSHCFSLWRNADQICPDCPLDALFESGDVCRYTERLITGDGSERVFEVIAAPIRAADGKIYQVVQLARDVTEREKMIRELVAARRSLEELNRKLEQQYMMLRTIAEVSDTLQQENSLERVLHIALTAVTAKEGLGFNRAFLLLVDSERKALVGKMAVGPSTPEEAGRIWSQLDDTPRTLSETLRAYIAATEEHDAEVNAIVKSIVIPLESDDVVVEVLKSGEPALVVPEDPNLWERASSLREKLRSPFFVIVPLWSMTKPVGVLIADNMITQKPITPREVELLRSLSSHFSLAIERTALTEELRRSYEQLRANQQRLLEAEKLSAIGSMAAQIAHEIRNPLVSIGGFARSLLAEKEPSDPDYEALNIILEEVKRLEGVVVDVLNYARVGKVEKKPGDINQTVYDVLLLFEPEFEKRNIDVEVETSDEIPPFGFDHDRIKQVLINLIRNSLNVLDDGGKIRIRTHLEGKYCWIAVSDNGPGIPSELGDKIFRPFFTTRTTGTGLGLSISARIVAAHGGTIWYENNPAGGVTFYIKLPLGD